MILHIFGVPSTIPNIETLNKLYLGAFWTLGLLTPSAARDSVAPLKGVSAPLKGTKGSF